MSAYLIGLALRRARRRCGPLPEGTRREALVLLRYMYTGSAACVAPIRMLRPPSAHEVADGVVALARAQAARGIRTIGGR